MYGPELSRLNLGGPGRSLLRMFISNGTPRMPGFKNTYNSDQIAAIAAYIKSLPPGTARYSDRQSTGKNAGAMITDNDRSHREDIMGQFRRLLLASLIAMALAAIPFSMGAVHADTLLTGTISSAGGEKMGGVTVSAKAEGSTITTSVFTDAAGNFYFPPLANGKYRDWAKR